MAQEIDGGVPEQKLGVEVEEGVDAPAAGLREPSGRLKAASPSTLAPPRIRTLWTTGGAASASVRLPSAAVLAGELFDANPSANRSSTPLRSSEDAAVRSAV